MTERVIDLSDEAAELHIRYDNLIVERSGAEDVSVPLCDLAVLVVSHPQVTYTHSVLWRIPAAGGVFISCDDHRLPVGMLLPIEAHFLQTERFAQQACASLPTRKRLWRQIVRAKVRAQGRLLKRLRGHDSGLLALAQRVGSGDPSNIEAQASRRYWPRLFADKKFRRRRTAADQNRLLNYGYAVLRATVARAVCGAGLHPSVGVHHKNRYNSYCLADDLMEPFRPIIDEAVARWVAERGAAAPLDAEAKAAILQGITGRWPLEGESRSLFDLLSRTASSLAAVFAGEGKDLVLPEV